MTPAPLRRVVPAGFGNPQSERRQEEEQPPSPPLRVDDSSHTLSIVSSPTAAVGKQNRGQGNDDVADIEEQRQSASMNALFGGSKQQTVLEAPSSSDGDDTTSKRVSKIVASRRPSLLLKGPLPHPIGTTQKKWLFVGLILLIGGACAGAFLALGILGAQNDAHKQFEQRSIDLTYGIASAAHDYELFGLW